jgi:hypothetical protein
VDQLTPAVGDEEEDVERAERERLHREQIGRPDRVRVGV